VWAVVQGIIKLQFLGPVSFAILILGLLGSAEQAQASAPPVVFWDRGAGTDNWSDPLNWSDNVLPNQKACEDIFIDVVGDGNVLFDVGSFDVCGSLNIGEGVTLTIINTNTLSNDFGTCTINNNGTIIINGTLLNTGLFNNNGLIINNADLRNSGGTQVVIDKPSFVVINTTKVDDGSKSVIDKPSVFVVNSTTVG